MRDIYDIDDRYMLIVTTDRISAFDVILSDPVPQKGAILTSISDFWFDQLRDVISNHIDATMSLEEVLPIDAERKQAQGRSMIVKRLKPLPIEAIVRGYLIGSGWKDYQNTGKVCGIDLPEGLSQAQKLPETIFTPSTKAAVGDHDENISFDVMCKLIDPELAKKIRDISIKIYEIAADYAIERGIIIADTKFEFGLDDDGRLYLIDEALTPDSSRFWPADQYKVGTSPPSFDKQYIRDYLETLDWNKQAPGPELPPNVLEKSGEKYREAMERLCN